MKSYILFFLIIFQWSFAQNDSIYVIGEQLINENKLDEAKVHFENNLKNAISDELKIKLLIGLADVHKAEINNLEASKNYTKALQLAKKTNNIQLEFLCHVKIGEFYRRRHLIPEFEKELEKATILQKKHRINDKYLTKYYNRKAALFTEFYNNNDSTLFYAKKSLELAKIVKDKDNVFYSTLEIAGVYERKREYKKAIQYIESILYYSIQNNMVQHQSDAYVSYIMALSRDNQKGKALEVALQAREFAKNNNLPIDENHFNEYIYQIYLSSENYKKAHEYLRYFNDLKYKLDKVQIDKELRELETKHKSKEKDNQIKIINLEVENKNKELTTTRAKFLLLSGLFALAIFSIFLIIYFLKKIKSTNKELQFLSNQNEFLLSEANHRINNNLQLIIVLISDQISNMPDNESNEIKKILKKINSIATLHRHLYQSHEKSSVNSYSYLNDIKDSFQDLFMEHTIKTNFNIDSLQLPIDMAMYLGLLLSELCINSIKHAFADQADKEINFDLNKKGDFLFFNYYDNGKSAIGTDIKPRLIDKLCRQLRIDYNINTSKGFNLSFQIKIK